MVCRGVKQFIKLSGIQPVKRWNASLSLFSGKPLSFSLSAPAFPVCGLRQVKELMPEHALDAAVLNHHGQALHVNSTVIAVGDRQLKPRGTSRSLIRRQVRMHINHRFQAQLEFLAAVQLRHGTLHRLVDS